MRKMELTILASKDLSDSEKVKSIKILKNFEVCP